MSDRRNSNRPPREAPGPPAAERERDLNSLRSKALQRAAGGQPPRTLTPYEWEQWYAAHGIPESHRRATATRDNPSKEKRWWQFWK